MTKYGVCNISANTLSPCDGITFASSLVFCSKRLLKTLKGQQRYRDPIQLPTL